MNLVYSVSMPTPGSRTDNGAPARKPIDAWGRDLAGRYDRGPRIPVDERDATRKVPGESKAERRMRRARVGRRLR